MQFCFNGRFFDSSEEAGINIKDEENSPQTVFETMRTYNSKDLFAVEEHLKRLLRSSKILGFSSSIKIEKIKNALKKIVEINASPDFNLRIKILLTENSFWIYTQPLTLVPAEIYTKGVEIRSKTFSRPTPEAKYPNPSYRHFQESLKGNEFETIFFDKNGYLREGNISNVFAVFGNTVVTPKERVLHGITRRKVIELIKKDKNLILSLREIHKDELQKADEIFLTNTTKEIVPVKKWNKWENDEFAVAQKLRKNF